MGRYLTAPVMATAMFVCERVYTFIAMSSSQTYTPVEAARLEWRDGQPYSRQFGDIYFSSQGGLQETEYVFLQANRLAARWQASKLDKHDPPVFVIAETGFGTSLNFLATIRLWRQVAAPEACLHYMAVERYPLQRQDVARALQLFPELQCELEALLAVYPSLTPGIHRLSLFAGQVQLTLAFMDIVQWSQIVAMQADAWFLDGFAPARNQAMWTPAVLAFISHNTRAGGTLSTFTAAGDVRRALLAAGFEVQKIPGFAGKRDMLIGRRQAVAPVSSLPAAAKPWFYPLRCNAKQKTAVVIGAGLAGAFTAAHLAERGWQVHIIERQSQVAAAASGNPAGVIFSKFSAYEGVEYRYYQQAFLYALHYLAQRFPVHKDIHRCGVLQLAFDTKEHQRQQAIINTAVWPEHIVRQLTAAQASECAGIALQHGGLFFPQAGWLSPPALCAALLQHANISSQLSSEALSLAHDNQQWHIYAAGQQHLAAADVVVIANANDAVQFQQTDFLPLMAIRGQTTQLQASRYTETLKRVLCYEGYITPASGGEHSIGASYNLRDLDASIRPSDDQENYAMLQGVTTGLPAYDHVHFTAARVGFRCCTPDYLPLVGPVPDIAAYKDLYAGLRGGNLKCHYPVANYLPNLFVNLAHGSRGITSAPLAAALLVAYINNEPSPVDQQLRQALHPARFPIKQLQRRKL